MASENTFLGTDLRQPFILELITSREAQLEVHPPEHGIHSWRDFFVHMGTICLGLLIAIALEQAVELAHQRSERHEIQEALRKDLHDTLHDTQITEETINANLAWAEETVSSCRAAAQAHRTCELKSRPSGAGFAPFTDPSFRAARASGLLVLLPQESVREFSGLDDRVDIEERFFETQEQSARRVQSFYRQFGMPGAADSGWQRATPEELSRFIEALNTWDGDLRNMWFIDHEAHDLASSLLSGQ